MKITQNVLTIELKDQEIKTLSNVCELARRFMTTRECNYTAEVGDKEADNIRDFIQSVFDLSRH